MEEYFYTGNIPLILETLIFDLVMIYYGYDEKVFRFALFTYKIQ